MLTGGGRNHGLYGSTSCCISHGPSQWERAIFDPPQLRDTDTDPISWNLKYITTSRKRLRMQNFRGLCRRGWSGQIASWRMKVSVIFFLLFSPRPQAASLDAPPRTLRHYTSFWPRWCLLGVIKMNFDIWHLILPENVNIGTLSWRSMAYKLQNRYITSWWAPGHIM